MEVLIFSNTEQFAKATAQYGCESLRDFPGLASSQVELNTDLIF